jgi:hypothetical protein
MPKKKPDLSKQVNVKQADVRVVPLEQFEPKKRVKKDGRSV